MGKTWKKGDLGRFEAEDDKSPRFVFLGTDKAKANAHIWYGGEATPTTVPLKTFLRDCVSWWVFGSLIEPPEWLKPGQLVTVSQPNRKSTWVTQARVPDRRRIVSNHRQVDIQNKVLQVRSIRRDYASCWIPEDRILALVPLVTLVNHGFVNRTRFDVLADDDYDPITEPEEELDLDAIFGD